MNESLMGGIQAIEQGHGTCLPTCKAISQR